MKKTILAIAVLVISATVQAKPPKTLSFTGSKTGIKRNITVVIPGSYKKVKEYNVIYSLHGWSGSYESWTSNPERRALTEGLADKYNIIIVIPDGHYDTWYIDSKLKGGLKYETYIAKDVVKFIDKKYSTNENRSGRGITGFSMGGFGALHIAINNQDVFGAAGSMSGGLDLVPYALNWSISSVLGDYSKNKALWESMAIINNLHKLSAGNNKYEEIKKYTNGALEDSKNPPYLPIAFETGVDDFFLEGNRKLHNEMVRQNIRHDYTERPGGHTFDYWNNAIKYQIQFLTDNLKKTKTTKKK